MRDFDDPIYKEWRKRVLQRDKHKCQMPGCKRRGKRMQTHHIRKWSSIIDYVASKALESFAFHASLTETPSLNSAPL